MSKPDETTVEDTLEEKRRRFYERCATPIPDAPPRSRAIAVAVDAQTAENIRTRPESVRIVTDDEYGVTQIARPRRYTVDAGASCAVGWTTPGSWFTHEDDPKVRALKVYLRKDEN
jgi:hypothetical protein